MTWRRRLAVGIVIAGAWLTFTGRPAATEVSPLTALHSNAVTVRLGPGRDSAALTVRRPQGEITLYRIRAPEGARVQATVQIPGLTTRLAITTAAASPTGACHAVRGFRTCTNGEEGCPMPVATWHVVVRKLAGAAGDVTIWFRVGKPPAVTAA
jgi:hypothetical protein